MKQLEFKDIAGYLPYGIEFILSEKGVFNLDSEYGTPYQAYRPMRIIGTLIGDTIEIDIHSTKENWGVGYIGLDEVKPILHPLSDLTKEIEHNGGEFVPMLHLAGIAFDKLNRHEFVLESNFIRLSSNYAYTFHFDRSECSFDCMVNYDGKKWGYNCYVPNQLQLFQKLYEWHFDLHNLIESGLAIDINTL